MQPGHCMPNSSSVERISFQQRPGEKRLMPSEKLECPQHVFGQRCMESHQPPGGGMGQHEPRRMEMQLAARRLPKACAPTAPEVLLTSATILAITGDRGADRGHMSPELMRASSKRPECDNRGPCPCRIKHSVIGRRPPRTIGGLDIVRVEDLHPLPVPASGRLHETIPDCPCRGRWPPRDHGYIGLLDFTGAEGSGQRNRRRSSSGQHEKAGRVSIETMHKARIILPPEPKRHQGMPEVPMLRRPALDGKPRRLVEDDHVIVEMQHGIHKLCSKGLVRSFGGTRILPAGRRNRGRGFRKGRNPDDLARQNPRSGLYTPAIDTDFPLSAHLFKATLTHTRKLPAKPPVEPLLGLVGPNRQMLHPAH